MPFAFAQSRRGTIKSPNGRLVFPVGVNPAMIIIGSDSRVFLTFQPNGDGTYGSDENPAFGNCDWFAPLTTGVGERYEAAVLLNTALGTDRAFTPPPSTWVSLADAPIEYRNLTIGGDGAITARVVFRLKGTTQVLRSVPVTFTANNDGD